ncbi:MAG: DUF1847 domain-containing protein [Gemmatimonadota bacterium]|nr:MAG: DUF1847 domain-containing protein [Gemmatimonadota bacterium]
MRNYLPDFDELYSGESSKRLAFHSALVEAQGYCHWHRLREIVEFAERMQYRRIGIAHCPDMAREAVLAAIHLEGSMLEASLPPEERECNPLGQAAYFAEIGTRLNVITGMCAGHEATFVQASEAPVTSLVTRDEHFRHNPVAALYTADGYSHSALFNRWSSQERPRFRGSDIETLAEVAEELTPAEHDRRCRLEEIMEFAHRLGASHIGVSFCVGMYREARTLVSVLEANDFQVSSVCCKIGAIPKEHIGIAEWQKVKPHEPEMICNTLAQAELLNASGAQLVLFLGPCVGHDSATLSRLKAPALWVVTKDRVLAHNTVAALYQLED